MAKADKRGTRGAAHLLRDWHSLLRDQLRLSAHTVAAYLRDVGGFLAFLVLAKLICQKKSQKK